LNVEQLARQRRVNDLAATARKIIENQLMSPDDPTAGIELLEPDDRCIYRNVVANILDKSIDIDGDENGVEK
jgi:hypothetical protein